MTGRRIAAACAVTSVLMLLFAAPAFADVVPWAYNASNSNERFGWANGQHENMTGGTAHGSPVVNKDGFFFDNSYGDMHFLARWDVAPKTINAGISVEVNTANSTPAGAPALDKLIIIEFGTWGGVQSALSFQGDFTIYEYLTGDTHDTGAISLPAPTFNQDGTWRTEIEFTPGPGNTLGAPWTNPDILSSFKLRVRNLIGARGTSGGPGTFMEKKGLYIIPEPASLLLFSAMLPLIRRPRRR